MTNFSPPLPQVLDLDRVDAVGVREAQHLGVERQFGLQAANDVGGLAGGNYGSIANTYAWGEVTGSSGAYYVSALVGYIAGPGTVSYSYATGAVFGGKNDIGGLIGGSRGSTTNSYWDTETTGQTFSAGGAGKTDTQMKTASTYTGWDTASIWNIVDGNYPTLK